MGRSTVAVAAALVLAATAHAAPAATCDAAGTQRTFRAFVAAFNDGDLARLDSLFAQPPAFRWYSSSAPGQRTGAASSTRSTLRPYFRERHRVRDVLAVRSFHWNGTARGLAHFSFGLRRSALDHLRGTPFDLVGKGALECAGGRFVVLSLGGPKP